MDGATKSTELAVRILQFPSKPLRSSTCGVCAWNRHGQILTRLIEPIACATDTYCVTFYGTYGGTVSMAAYLAGELIDTGCNNCGQIEIKGFMHFDRGILIVNK